MLKKFQRKLNKKEIVFAEQVKADDQKILLKEYAEYKEVVAQNNDWIVTFENGNQKLFSEEDFKIYYEPIKELLLD